jgi:hypothetical protein
MTLPVVQQLFWHADLAMAAALLLRLVMIGVVRKYRALSALLGFSVARTLLLMSLPLHTSAYGYTYLLLTPGLWLLLAWAALEVYRHVFESYQRLSILGRGFLVAAFAASLAVAGVILALQWTPGRDPFPSLRALLLSEQASALTLFFFLLILVLFLLWYPVPLRRNLFWYAFGLSLYVFHYAAAVALRMFAGHEWTDAASTVNLAMSALSRLGWCMLLSQKGEKEVRRGAIPRGSEAEQRLLGQLRALNSMLEAPRKP